MIELRGRWIATACALASLTLTSTASLAAPMIQGDGPMINGSEATLAETATSSNDTQSNTDLSQQTEPKAGFVNESSSTTW